MNGPEDTRQEKHIALHEAIEHIGSIVQCLDELIIRVRGPVPQTGAEGLAKSSMPTLEEVLSGGPEMIRDKVAEAHKRIEEINNILF